MSGIKLNQTAARITIKTKLNFQSVGARNIYIDYQKPDGTKGTWTSAMLSSDLIDGAIYIDFSTINKFDQLGTWTLAPHIIFEDGREAWGDNISYVVRDSV